jgi:uncharacterized oxidoreductase
MPRFSADSLRAMATSAFEAAGFGADDAALIAKVMVESNLVGHDSHGVRHIPAYVERIRDGLVVAGAKVEVVMDDGALAIVDGGNTLGHVAATRGIELAMAKARSHGIAAVAVRNQEHVGRVGAYPEMAAQAGLVAFTFCNAQGRGIQIAAFGGLDRRIGANPIAAGFPNPDGDPIVLDIATSQVAINKIRQAHDRAKPLPEGAIIDPDGKSSTDPDDFLARGGAALPLGGLAFGHKGFGLAVVVDLLAGVLGGAGTAAFSHETRLNNGTFHIVIDPARFVAADAYAQAVREFARHLHDGPTLPGTDAVMLPGEFEANNRAERSANGIEVDAPVWERITATLADLGVQAPPPLA